MSVISAMSLCQIGVGTTNSFLAFVFFRVIHGIFCSAINPTAYSLVSDLFPDDRKTSANSILSIANFVGTGLSSFSIILIKYSGWRAVYLTMAAMGLFSAAALSLVKTKQEPEEIIEAESTRIKETLPPPAEQNSGE